MKEQFASYFDKPKFKRTLAQYEEMLLSGGNFYFESTELTDIAEYYAMQGDSLRAEAALDYAIQLHPDNLDALIFKARARLINGNLAEARRIAENLPDSNDREVIFLKAELTLAMGQDAKANDILRALIETEAYEVNTYVDIIDLLVDNKKIDMAEMWLEEANTRFPERQALLESSAYCHTTQERFDEAITLYNQLLDIDAYNSFYWEELGKIYFLLEKYDKAIEAFEFVIAINGDDCYYAMYAIANCYFNMGNFAKAEEYYQKISQQYPEAIDTLYHMGMCRINMNDDDKALEYFTEALAHTIENSDEQGQIYSQLSLIFSRREQHSKAIIYIDEALKIYPDNTELIIMKGHELLCNGEFEESTDLFIHALNSNAEHTEHSLFLIGVSMLENGHYDMSYYILHLLKGNPNIEPSVLYPYLCLCEWMLRKDTLKETLAYSLSICPTKTYEIFTLDPTQGESAESMIQRLKTINN